MRREKVAFWNIIAQPTKLELKFWKNSSALSRVCNSTIKMGDHNNGVRMHKMLQTNNVLSQQAKRTTMLPSVETESVVQGQKSALASGSRLSAPLTLEIGPPGYAAAVCHLDTDFRAACNRKSLRTKRILWVSADANYTPQPPIDRAVAASWKYSCLYKVCHDQTRNGFNQFMSPICAAHTVRLCPICRVGTDSLLEIYHS